MLKGRLALMLWFAAAWQVAASATVMRVVSASKSGIPLLRNGGFESLTNNSPLFWRPWQKGFQLASSEGRAGSSAAMCQRSEGEGEFGASQTLELGRTNVAPLIIRGWSKAEDVSGSPDNGYSLYVDIVYADGTPLWGQTATFRCGTHGWEERRFVLLPDKPVRQLTLHCLFRGHTGKVWFDDISLEEAATPTGALLFQGVPIAAGEWPPAAGLSARETVATGDGLKLGMDGASLTSLQVGPEKISGASAGGFIVRDFASNSDFFAFDNGKCDELGLRIERRFKAGPDHLAVEGFVEDVRGRDRAITLLFALPVDGQGWRWGDDARQSRIIGDGGEFANTTKLRSGADGRMSRYPLAAIWNDRLGLALGLDMDHPAQYRLVYHAGTRQFFIAYDFGLTGDTARFPRRGEFRFVIFRFEPRWGFRAALQKFYDIFPRHFAKRVKREGTWMPFTDIARVPGFEDFGFAFQEGAPDVPFDDAHGIASFVYVEPMSYWLELPASAPRTYESAMAVLRADLDGARGNEKRRMAAATFTSGIHTSDGRFPLHLVKAPWCDGGVFTLNPDPGILGNSNYTATKASVMREAIHAAFEKNKPATNSPGAGLDGVYFDSFEMSATELNYRRDHFRTATVPLVFDSEGRSCELMVFNTWQFAREIAAEMHARDKLTFANAVLSSFSFPAPLLDVLGIEVNWLHQGEYAPDTDAVMNFRRALSRQKPYCLLMNTDYGKFTPALVERYFQRCLFYGIWPGFFDQEAASKDPYWASAKRWYDRDRALFKKYIPLFQRVAAAGWEPVTGATCDNPKLWLERYGGGRGGKIYLAVFNDTPQLQAGVVVVLDRDVLPMTGKARVRELLSGETVRAAGQGWGVRVAPQEVGLLEFVP